jgi:glutamate dehydrogenase/leucine dehydrogenase
MLFILDIINSLTLVTGKGARTWGSVSRSQSEGYVHAVALKRATLRMTSHGRSRKAVRRTSNEFVNL